MTENATKNFAESVRRRLLNQAKEQDVEFTHILIRYAIERTLYRLSISEHADRFCLKGAMLLALWSKQPYRPTLDVDLLSVGDPSIESMRKIFSDVLKIDCPEDALVIKSDALKLQPIKEGQQYEGLRVTFSCELDQAIVPVQIDIGFGDVVTPSPIRLAYSTILATTFEFEGELLASAISATFNRRSTMIPHDFPTALTEQFYGNSDKQKQWSGFLKKSKIGTLSLEMVCLALGVFLMPLCQAIRGEKSPPNSWVPLSGWDQE